MNSVSKVFENTRSGESTILNLCTNNKGSLSESTGYLEIFVFTEEGKAVKVKLNKDQLVWLDFFMHDIFTKKKENNNELV